jgi:3-methyl-2-oxobutanoate hydroxymethyltransferase
MSSHQAPRNKKTTIRDLARMKAEGRKIVCLTAYTAPIARLMDPHVDLILVGDSLGMVVYGLESTVPVTLEMMIAHGQAVMRGADKAMVVVDMPFGSYQESAEQAFRHAARIMKETGCAAVKLEGGRELAETVRFLTERGIPVFGHIGLKPQSVNAVGGYRMLGRQAEEAAAIIADAQALEEAGAFAAVLECVDAGLSDRLAASVSLPIIGIGATASCAGQILVVDDMLGMLPGPAPKFVKPYAALRDQVASAIQTYAEEVRNGSFPGQDHIYESAKPILLKNKN